MKSPVTEANKQKRLDQHLIWMIVILVSLILITPLIISTSTLFPFIVGKAIFARSIIEIIFALWLVLVIYYPQHRPSRSWVIGSLAIGLAVSIITSFTGVSPTRSMWSTFERMNGVIDQAHWLAFILVTGSVYRSISSWKALFTINLGVAGFISGIGLGQYYSRSNLFVEGLGSIRSTSYIESTLGNSAFMGTYTMINAVIGIGLILQSFDRKALDHDKSKRGWLYLLQIFWMINTILCIWSLWLTASRGSLLSLGLGSTVLITGYITWKTNRIRTGITCAALLLSLMTAALIVIIRGTTVIEDLEDSNPMIVRILDPEADSSYSRRLTALRTTVSAYTEKPVFGWGPENYIVPWGKHYQPESPDHDVPPFDAAHNKLIEELVTKGTIGLLSYILIWTTIIAVLARSIKYRSGQNQFFIIITGAALIALFIQNIFTVDTTSITLQLSLLIAFIVSEEGRLKRAINELGAKDIAQGHSSKHAKSKPYYVDRKPWLTVLIVIASIWSLYSFNLKPYRAAQTATELGRTNLWTDMTTNFTKSVDTFPPLANIPRRLMIDHVGSSITDLTSINYVQAVNLVTREGQRALKVEPQNWLLHISLAQFYQQAYLYQQAYQQNTEYLTLANVHIQEAAILAPNTSQTIATKAEQERLEQLGQGAS